MCARCGCLTQAHVTRLIEYSVILFYHYIYISCFKIEEVFKKTRPEIIKDIIKMKIHSIRMLLVFDSGNAFTYSRKAAITRGSS